MILNTGMRTDIPAYFSEWFLNRIKEGYVLTRNPYNPLQVTKYRLDPEVVDILVFGTKNPGPLIPHLDQLEKFRTYWFVTMNPYGMELAGAVETCMIAFLDLYEKTKRNFPEGRAVTKQEKARIGKAFVQIGLANNIKMIGCYEDADLAEYGVDVSGCMTHHALEHIGDFKLTIPKSEKGVDKQLGSSAAISEAEMREHREHGGCILGKDIGEYNTCPHGCKYCYANYDQNVVREKIKHHDIHSPYLIGRAMPDEKIYEARQESWIENQLSIFDFFEGM